MKGDPDVSKLVIPNDQDNEIDALRKLRLAQMKGHAEQRKRWLELGHGAYEQLDGEAKFLEALPKHGRAVCAISAPGSMDGELLHRHHAQEMSGGRIGWIDKAHFDAIVLTSLELQISDGQALT